MSSLDTVLLSHIDDGDEALPASERMVQPMTSNNDPATPLDNVDSDPLGLPQAPTGMLQVTLHESGTVQLSHFEYGEEALPIYERTVTFMDQ